MAEESSASALRERIGVLERQNTVLKEAFLLHDDNINYLKKAWQLQKEVDAIKHKQQEITNNEATLVVEFSNLTEIVQQTKVLEQKLNEVMDNATKTAQKLKELSAELQEIFGEQANSHSQQVHEVFCTDAVKQEVCAQTVAIAAADSQTKRIKSEEEDERSSLKSTSSPHDQSPKMKDGVKQVVEIGIRADFILPRRNAKKENLVVLREAGLRMASMILLFHKEQHSRLDIDEFARVLSDLYAALGPAFKHYFIPLGGTHPNLATQVHVDAVGLAFDKHIECFTDMPEPYEVAMLAFAQAAFDYLEYICCASSCADDRAVDVHPSLLRKYLIDNRICTAAHQYDFEKCTFNVTHERLDMVLASITTNKHLVSDFSSYVISFLNAEDD